MAGLKKNNLIAEKTFQFSVEIIKLFKALKNEREFIVSKQLLRSGTSIGANIEEAIAAQSRKDFINKLSISSKEARETKYWLRLLDKSELSDLNVEYYLEEIDHIINIITKIIITTKNTSK
ncbi:MAG: four helix bundle protein [Leeuwenhoekiella sp.]